MSPIDDDTNKASGEKLAGPITPPRKRKKRQTWLENLLDSCDTANIEYAGKMHQMPMSAKKKKVTPATTDAEFDNKDSSDDNLMEDTTRLSSINTEPMQALDIMHNQLEEKFSPVTHHN